MNLKDRLLQAISPRQSADVDETSIEAAETIELKYSLDQERAVNNVLVEKYIDLRNATLQKEYDHKIEALENEMQGILTTAGWICTRLGLKLNAREVQIDSVAYDTISRGNCAFEDGETVLAMKTLIAASAKYGVPWSGSVEYDVDFINKYETSDIIFKTLEDLMYLGRK